jgi:hypothetical protein
MSESFPKCALARRLHPNASATRAPPPPLSIAARIRYSMELRLAGLKVLDDDRLDDGEIIRVDAAGPDVIVLTAHSSDGIGIGCKKNDELILFQSNLELLWFRSGE